MRALVVMLLISRVAAATPAHCTGKPFQCHRLAVRAQLGIDGAVDLAGAATLYAEACAKGESASCNNLAVIALAHPELGKGVDPAAMFAKACNRLDSAACDNARRLTTNKEFAIRLSLGDTELTAGVKWTDLAAHACKAGDAFVCDDAGSRQRIEALLERECRAGVKTTCFAAARLATDKATTASLMGIACTAGEGRACYAIEKWDGACSDKDFDDDARSDGCARWAKTARQKAVQRRIATLAGGYCIEGRLSACSVAEELYDRAGDRAKAFEIAAKQCELDTTRCEDVAGRYVLGNGTTVDVAKGLELLSGACAPEVTWPVCKKIGRYREDHKELDKAVEVYTAFCDAGTDEACYLRTRLFEGADQVCGTSPQGLKASYDELCKKKFGDSCRRSASMCSRAMADFKKPDPCNHGGVGDGNVELGSRYHAVVELCPKSSWTPAVRAEMKKLEDYCKSLQGLGGGCN